MFDLRKRAAGRFTLGLTLLAVNALALAPSALARQSSPTGMFVIGDQSAATQSSVLFWGAQWWKDNGLSGGLAPASFKGFADSADPSTAQCGDTWSTRPGTAPRRPRPSPEMFR